MGATNADWHGTDSRLIRWLKQSDAEYTIDWWSVNYGGRGFATTSKHALIFRMRWQVAVFCEVAKTGSLVCWQARCYFYPRLDGALSPPSLFLYLCVVIFCSEILLCESSSWMTLHSLTHVHPLMHCTVPVSYTHLDVYKRQTWC